MLCMAVLCVCFTVVPHTDSCVLCFYALDVCVCVMCVYVYIYISDHVGYCDTYDESAHHNAHHTAHRQRRRRPGSRTPASHNGMRLEQRTSSHMHTHTHIYTHTHTDWEWVFYGKTWPCWKTTQYEINARAQRFPWKYTLHIVYMVYVGCIIYVYVYIDIYTMLLCSRPRHMRINVNGTACHVCGLGLVVVGRRSDQPLIYTGIITGTRDWESDLPPRISVCMRAAAVAAVEWFMWI